MAYEVVDHTADTGIRVKAPDLRSLFSEAARGMLEQMLDPQTIKPVDACVLAVEGMDTTDLMINTLRELLYLFAGKAMAVQSFVLSSLEDVRLTGRAFGEPFDPARHAVRTEIKAVTYAGGDIRKRPEGFEVTLIFDV